MTATTLATAITGTFTVVAAAIVLTIIVVVVSGLVEAWGEPPRPTLPAKRHEPVSTGDWSLLALESAPEGPVEAPHWTRGIALTAELPIVTGDRPGAIWRESASTTW